MSEQRKLQMNVFNFHQIKVKAHNVFSKPNQPYCNYDIEKHQDDFLTPVYIHTHTYIMV